jgi:GTP-binding protein
VALSKVDATDPDNDVEAIAQQLRQLSHAPVFLISAVARIGLDPMLQEVWQTLAQLDELATINS